MFYIGATWLILRGIRDHGRTQRRHRWLSSFLAHHEADMRYRQIDREEDESKPNVWKS
jgi:hypothetical protein